METIRTTGKMLPTHVESIVKKVTNWEHAHHPQIPPPADTHTQTTTIAAVGKHYFSLVIIRSFGIVSP